MTGQAGELERRRLIRPCARNGAVLGVDADGVPIFVQLDTPAVELNFVDPRIAEWRRCAHFRLRWDDELHTKAVPQHERHARVLNIGSDDGLIFVGAGWAMIYTAWGKDGRANTLVQGEGRPRFVDGTSFEDTEELIWRIEAESWEEAMQKYHALQGWEPYTAKAPASSY